MIIAVDGLTASGKGTLSKKLAQRFDLAHLDTGTLYRAVAAQQVEDGGDAAVIAQNLKLERFSDAALRNESVAQKASEVAANPDVRKALLAFQRSFAANPPPPAKGAVLDGRDIGTVICPDADLKLFVTATEEVRAARRTRELQGRGQEAIQERVLRDLRKRDERDRQRADAPSKAAPDAHILDTTDMSVDDAFDYVVGLVLAKYPDYAKA